MAPAPKKSKPSRGRSASAPPIESNPGEQARSKSAQKVAPTTPAPEVDKAIPKEKFKPASRLLVNEIAQNILEAIKVDGFDREDAVKALKVLKQLENADRKETMKLQDQLRGLYASKWSAMKTYNARDAAERREEAKRQRT